MLADRVGDNWLALVIARVTFMDGDAARYLLPLAWTNQAVDTEVIGGVAIGTAGGSFIDATETTWFGRWLVDAMLGGGSRTDPAWTFSAQPSVRFALETARTIAGDVMRGEQSNSSLRFGDVLIVKMVRRLQPGPNPDDEMLRALATVRFDRVPEVAGTATWRAIDGEEFPIALAQVYVPNIGDAWSWMLRRLEHIASGEIDHGIGNTAPEALLGRRTGELHVALSEIEAPAFVPEPPTGTAIAGDVRRTRDAIHQAISLLQVGKTRLPDSVLSRLPQTLADLERSAARAEGFRDECATWRIRVHGDFHLGQALRTPDRDWILIDFEGEPARPVSERREKTSALKDVAGMMRSFAYARGAVERSVASHDHEPRRNRLSAWEDAARQVFLDAYRDAIRLASVPLAPPDDQAFANALAAWELDKALYEIAYEVRNRPDWLELPLRALVATPSD